MPDLYIFLRFLSKNGMLAASVLFSPTLFHRLCFSYGYLSHSPKICNLIVTEIVLVNSSGKLHHTTSPAHESYNKLWLRGKDTSSISSHIILLWELTDHRYAYFTTHACCVSWAHTSVSCIGILAGLTDMTSPHTSPSMFVVLVGLMSLWLHSTRSRRGA